MERWNLVPDGEAFVTPYARNHLIAVRCSSGAAMLKLATSETEVRGGKLMSWWAGDGAPRVLARDGPALLLERLPVGRSLADMARFGDDDEATRILCAVADRIHAVRLRPPPTGLYRMKAWFKALAPMAAQHGGVLIAARDAANDLLATPQEVTVLHGDLHHENVLDGAARGWLVIDPKGLLGERGYDYATMLMNPDKETALRPERIARQVQVAAQAARLDPRRLSRWLLAHAGLSTAWCLAEGRDATAGRQIAELAAALVEAT